MLAVRGGRRVMGRWNHNIGHERIVPEPHACLLYPPVMTVHSVFFAKSRRFADPSFIREGAVEALPLALGVVGLAAAARCACRATRVSEPSHEIAHS